MKLNVYFIGFLLTSLLFSCKEDFVPAADHYFQIKVVPMFDGEELSLNTAYTDGTNTSYKFERIAFFGTNITLNNFASAAEAGLVNIGTNDYLFSAKTLVSELDQLNFNLGVSSDKNHMDPSAFSNQHPLNIANVDGLHWGWDPGYIFIAIEGKADTLLDDNVENYDRSFVYHIGKDDNLRFLSFSDFESVKINDSTHQVELFLDMNKVFHGYFGDIDVREEYTIHDGEQLQALAQKVLGNFQDAITKE